MPQTKKRKVKRITLRGSAIFGIKSFRRLSEIMRAPEDLLRHLADSDNNYIEFDLKGRWIENPKPALKRIHQRFSFLLSQIETPDYLHSGVKGRSYITNSSKHVANLRSVKVDVKKFYPSSRSAEVYRFLTEDLEWSKDVSGLFTRIMTIKGHLPTGGNASPILSFWAYKPLFDEVHDLASAAGCHFSLYIDDMTLSGELATRTLMRDVRSAVGRYRLNAHKFKVFSKGQTRVVTGVAQTRFGPKLPIRRQELIRHNRLALRNAKTETERLPLLRTLVGRLCEAVEIDPVGWNDHAKLAIKESKMIDRRSLRRGIITLPTAPIEVADGGTDAAPPWSEPILISTITA